MRELYAGKGTKVPLWTLLYNKLQREGSKCIIWLTYVSASLTPLKGRVHKGTVGSLKRVAIPTKKYQNKQMKSVIYDLVKNDNIRNEIKQILKPFGVIIYNEIYFYILLILVYCGLLFLAVLGILFYLIHIHKRLSKLDINMLGNII